METLTSDVEPAQLRPLDPRVRHVWWGTGVVTVVALLVPILVVDLLVWRRFVEAPVPAGVIPLSFTLVGGALAFAVPVLRYRRWRYALRERDLWIRHGVLWVKTTVIPFSRLQFVDTRQGPLDRLFGLAQLVVHTAALGTSGHLPGLAVDEAETLRERLAAVEPDAAGV